MESRKESGPVVVARFFKGCGAIILLAIATRTSAQDRTSISLSVLQGDGQTTVSGHVFDQRLAVRLTDSQGVPFASAPIYFENESCFMFNGEPCEFPAPAGHFESGGDHATVLTDSSGVAVAPPYYAGVGDGAIGVSAYALAGEAPYFFAFNVVVGRIVEFHLNEVPRLSPVPFLSTMSMCVLIALVALAAAKKRRPDHFPLWCNCPDFVERNDR